MHVFEIVKLQAVLFTLLKRTLALHFSVPNVIFLQAPEFSGGGK